MRSTKQFIIILLFVSVVSAALGFVSGERQALRENTQLASVDASGAIPSAPDVERKKKMAIVKPGAGCPSSNPQIQAKCDQNKTLAQKQVGVGIDKAEPPTVTATYTPSSCKADAGELGSGKCYELASEMCPTAQKYSGPGAGESCFWEKCKTKCGSDGKKEGEKKESLLKDTPMMPPSDTASSTPEQGGKEGSGAPMLPMLPMMGGMPPPETPPEPKQECNPAFENCSDEDSILDDPVLEAGLDEFNPDIEDIEPGGTTEEETEVADADNPANPDDQQNPGGVVPDSNTQETAQESIPERIATALGQSPTFGGIANWLGVTPTTPAASQGVETPQGAGIVGNPIAEAPSPSFIAPTPTNVVNNFAASWGALTSLVGGILGF